jgi:FkbM family methyltransferase
VSSRPSPLISYAQNGEDIVLARALRPWEKKGFWVDCGAGHPKYDSVTKLFSKFGWTGINIEPLDEEFMLLNQDRPNDHNIQCLLGSQSGVGSIFAGPSENRGSSTTDPLLVERYAKEFGQTFHESQVPIRTLTDILHEKQLPAIDFLKIDVEGAELEVLRGIDLSEFNPRIIVIEATQPNSTELVHKRWEDRVLSSGYVYALFDGLNRFYVKETDSELLNALLAPANVLDDFKSILQLELEQGTSSAQNTINAYIEQFSSAQRYAESLQTELVKKEQYAESLQTELVKKEQYAESLQTELQKHDLNIADHQQKVIDAEARNIILKTANEALENQLIKLHDVERQLATIRAYRLFKLLSLAKKVLRKATGRK